MIGIVVVGHDNLPAEFLKAAQTILPDFSQVTAVKIDSNAPLADSHQLVATAVQEVNTGDGVLILTDLFGSTPSNVCLSFLSPQKCEVISGINLPMLIKLGSGLQQKSLPEVVEFIKCYGQNNIVIASHILDTKK